MAYRARQLLGQGTLEIAQVPETVRAGMPVSRPLVAPRLPAALPGLGVSPARCLAQLVIDMPACVLVDELPRRTPAGLAARTCWFRPSRPEATRRQNFLRAPATPARSLERTGEAASNGRSAQLARRMRIDR